MKIIGVTYYDGSANLVLKSDSSMLVNRKPLFVPEAIGDLQALPCYVLRVSRLGKCVAQQFASRYYDAVAPGADFFGADLLREAKAAGRPWVEAVAFEGSLAIGAWQSAADARWLLERNGQQVAEQAWADKQRELFDEAVSRVSRLLTIRQGDLIYVASDCEPWRLQTNDIIRSVSGDDELLYCKIK